MLIKTTIYFGKDECIEGYVDGEELTLYQCGLTSQLTIHNDVEQESIGEQLTLDDLVKE